MDISNLSDTEFKVMNKKMLIELRRRMEKDTERLNKQLKYQERTNQS